MALSWGKDNRYYKLLFQPTLLGTMDVICVWGRVGVSACNHKYKFQQSRIDSG